jgi:hypothetical protein
MKAAERTPEAAPRTRPSRALAARWDWGTRAEPAMGERRRRQREGGLPPPTVTPARWEEPESAYERARGSGWLPFQVIAP